MNHESDHTVEAAKNVKDAGLLELFERCNYLYHEAFYANTELAILRELSKASSDYEKEVICASCFFSFTQLALTESCFMFTPKKLSLNAHMKNCSEIITKWLPCV